MNAPASPEALSARLLTDIGVGLCLIDAETRRIRFRNPTFAKWFADAEVDAPACKAIASLAPETLDGAADGSVFEMKAKVKRRALSIEARVWSVEDEGRKLLVLECQNVTRLRETEAMIDSYSAMVERRTRDLERQKAQVEKLLLNIMPKSVYDEYMSFGSVAPRIFEPVSVLMLDFVGFTEMAVAADPAVTVAELNEIFTAFDRIGERYGCERIKTSGDCYLAVAGLPHPNPDHARSIAECALKMIRYLGRRNSTSQHQWLARIGLASGSVVGSVVGVQKYIYDVFGPAVNLASRLQSLSAPMEITLCSSMTPELDDEFRVSSTRREMLRGFGEVSVSTLAERAQTGDALV